MTHEKLTGLRSRMVEAREKALKSSDGPGFGSLAIEYSEDQATRYKGGDIGWIEEGRGRYRWDSKVIAAGFSLGKIGEISEIIATDSGLFLVKLLDRREPVVSPLEQVKERIRHKLVLEKRKQIEKEFLEEMRAGTAIEIYPEVLEAVKPPASPQPRPGEQKPPDMKL